MDYGTMGIGIGALFYNLRARARSDLLKLLTRALVLRADKLADADRIPSPAAEDARCVRIGDGAELALAVRDAAAC